MNHIFKHEFSLIPVNHQKISYFRFGGKYQITTLIRFPRGQASLRSGAIRLSDATNQLSREFLHLPRRFSNFSPETLELLFRTKMQQPAWSSKRCG